MSSANAGSLNTHSALRFFASCLRRLLSRTSTILIFKTACRFLARKVIEGLSILESVFPDRPREATCGSERIAYLLPSTAYQLRSSNRCAAADVFRAFNRFRAQK